MNPFKRIPDARLETLNKSNESPEESELGLIHSVISCADARIAFLDNEIPKIRAKLMKFEEERASLIDHRQRNQAILSPLRRLPPELLGDIFSWTFSPLAESWGRHESMADTPWVLSHVCRRWRDICLSTPSLWACILIDYTASSPRIPTLPLVNTRLQRAQRLKIHFYASDKSEHLPQVEMLQLLLEHSSRWEELSLRLSPSIVPLLTTHSIPFPSLKRLWLEWDSAVTWAAMPPLNCFQAAPCLADCSIINDEGFVPMVLPLHQFTRCELTRPWDEHGDLLQLGVNLVELRIFEGELWRAHDVIIQLPLLQRLSVSRLETLAHFKTPSLDGLSVYIFEQDVPEVDLLKSFLHRSECRLRSFVVNGWFSSDIGVKVLQMLPSISELVIITVGHKEPDETTHPLITVLTVSSRLLVPQLRSISLGWTRGGGMDYRTFYQMLASRWRGGTSALRAATLVTGEHDPDSATLADLDELCREGLDLGVSVYGRDARYACMTRWRYGSTWNL
ncbi:ABC protein [Favolaschia claudopus]|uniref:ABC protein n=1 Tax=Favolaschia claudopus TaxID=2862362 RepID=A0AAW0BXJ7_9AGAR